MLFIEFKNKLSPYEVFSTRDIDNYFPNFDSRRLNEWQKKKYIIKLRNGWYCFSDYPDGEAFSVFIGNKIYDPSYLSLELALSIHAIIPEAVYTATSVTTNKTMAFDTPLREYTYNSVKEELFFGYEVQEYSGRPVKIAYPEKAILDFLYLRKHYVTESDMIELRFDLDDISVEKLRNYLEKFKSTALENRVTTLLKVNDIN